MSSYISTSHFVSAFAARSSILRMRQSHQQRLQWTHKLFRKRGQNHPTNTSTDGAATEPVVRQVRQTTWPEVTRLLSTGMAGYWSMAVFLIVGFSACHITGPSVVMSVVITAITSVLTGKMKNIILSHLSLKISHARKIKALKKKGSKKITRLTRQIGPLG